MNTGVGCHFLLQCMKVKNESEVAQSCPTLRDPMDCSTPGSSIHEIFQAGVLCHCLFQYTETNYRNTIIPFTIASKNKILRNIFKQGVERFMYKTFKTLMKEMYKDTKGNIFHIY